MGQGKRFAQVFNLHVFWCEKLRAGAWGTGFAQVSSCLVHEQLTMAQCARGCFGMVCKSCVCVRLMK